MLREYYSTPSLAGMLRAAADQLGYGRHFSGPPGAVEDDHVPFLRLGVPAADLIDFDYGPGNRYWHTEEDTIDKLSADSLRVVGEVLLKVLEALESQPPP
jgi:Zn-dependent M28 family amino/carboxypeptidase